MPTPDVLPMTGVAFVLGLHDVPDPEGMPELTAEPVIAWAVRTRKFKALDHDTQRLVSLHPMSPTFDGIPTPFEGCSHTLGWIVVHGILTMSTLQDQVPVLVRAALGDFCASAEERGAHYVDSDGLSDNSPEALLHGQGKWAADSSVLAEQLDITTAKLSKLAELVEADEWDLDQFSLSEELLRLVIH